MSENTNRKVLRKEFTCHFADLHSLLVLDYLEKEFAELLKVPVSMFSEHYHALLEIVFGLNSFVLKAVVGERFPS